MFEISSYCEALKCDLKTLNYEEIQNRIIAYFEAKLQQQHVCVHEMKAPEGSNGQSALSRCARCKGVYYRTAEGQKSNWKVHKLTCKVPNPLLVAGYSIPMTWQKMKDQLVRMVFDENFGMLLRHLRNMWDKFEGDTALEGDIHGTCRNLIFLRESTRTKIMFESMWSAPGVADYFCFNEDLVYSYLRRQRVIFPLGLPSPEAVKVLMNNAPEMKALAEKLQEEEIAEQVRDDECKRMKFCHFHYTLLMACAVEGTFSLNFAMDGCGQLRSGAVAEAAMKRCIEIWLDEHARLSCGDALAPAYSFAITYIKARRDQAGPEEIAPLCPCDKVLMACLQEILESGSALLSAAAIVKMLSEMPGNPWAALSIRRRAEVAILLAESIACSEGDLNVQSERDGKAMNVYDLKLHVILDKVCSVDNASDRLAVWRAAAYGSNWCPLGRLDTGRAFFHYMLIIWDIPVLLPTDRVVYKSEEDFRDKYDCLDQYQRLDAEILELSVCDAILNWALAPWPRSFNTENQIATDKLESYRKAMEPERFESFARIYDRSSATSNGGRKKYRAKPLPEIIPQKSAEEIRLENIRAEEIAAMLIEEEAREKQQEQAKPKKKKGKKLRD